MKRNILGLLGSFAAMFVVVAVILAGAAHPAHAATLGHIDILSMFGGLIGAQAVSYSKVSDFSKAYKRSSTKLYRQYTRRVAEYGWMDETPDEEIVPSGRENLVPVDLTRGFGAAMIEDGGYEALTASTSIDEGAFVFNHINARFAISLRAQAFDRAAKGNQVIRQIKLQSLKCVEAVMRKFAYMFYGFSTGVLAKCSGDPGAGATSHTITLKDAFGVAGAGNAAYLAGMFTVGEGVALIRTGALVTNAIGLVTAVSKSAGTITVTWGGSVDPAADDSIVYANTVTDATITATDYNKWNVGLLDVLTSTSLLGLAGTTTNPTWNPALYDTNGGSFGFVKVKKLRQALENEGDTTLRRLILANGVENDMQARERGALLWSDSGSMNLDANVRAKGVRFDTSRFTPPGFAFALGADAMGKKVLTERPDEEELIDFGKLFKAEDRSALKGGVDMICANIPRARSRFAGYSGLNEQ